MNQIKWSNNVKNLKNDSHSTNLKNKQNMMCSPRNEKNQKLDVIKKENLRSADLKKISINKKWKVMFLRKIKNPKSPDQFEDECQINYYENYEIMKRKQKFTKKKLGNTSFSKKV